MEKRNEIMSSVRLISVTKPLIDDIENVQELIAYCARVSNPSNQMNVETSGKLLEYCMKNKHWSIFEMASACLEINTTRDIARQILRHRSFSFQEFSQRYADPTKDLTFIFREARLQDAKNRQNSIEVDDPLLNSNWLMFQEDIRDITLKAYNWAIQNGIAKEVARAVLPEGLISSRMYMQGTIRSWIHYIETRTDISTQKEHREIALLCAKEIAKIMPQIFNFVSQNKTVNIGVQIDNKPQIKVSEWIGL